MPAPCLSVGYRSLSVLEYLPGNIQDSVISSNKRKQTLYIYTIILNDLSCTGALISVGLSRWPRCWWISREMLSERADAAPNGWLSSASPEGLLHLELPCFLCGFNSVSTIRKTKVPLPLSSKDLIRGPKTQTKKTVKYQEPPWLCQALALCWGLHHPS